MSYSLTKWALKLKGISATEKLVLAQLCTYADEEGRCFPKQSRIADECGLSRQSVITCLKKLRSIGAISIENNGDYIITPVNDVDTYVNDVDIKGVKHVDTYVKEIDTPVNDVDIHLNRPINKSINRPIEKVKKENYDLDFQEFWSAYPNKVGKPVSKTSFEKVRKRFSQAEIMSGLSRYIESKPPDRAWCNPSTFLNQERFNDEPSNPIPKSQFAAGIQSKGSRGLSIEAVARAAAKITIGSGGQVSGSGNNGQSLQGGIDRRMQDNNCSEHPSNTRADWARSFQNVTALPRG